MSKNSSLKDQVFLYSLETRDFYTEEESYLSDKYFKALRIKKRISLKFKCTEDDLKLELYKKQKKKMNTIVKTHKDELESLIKANKNVRELNVNNLKTNKIISIFDSTLTRVCKMKTKELTDKMFIIRVFHYDILKSILEKGFNYQGKHYQYFTSSAGQIRTKKIVCIESELYEKHEKTITCDLPVSVINSKGGVNANKYQAYLALINSASEKWLRFNIDRIAVVDDFSTLVNSEVDYIDSKTFDITRKTMDIPIDHMDGCGIMLPTVSKKSFMFRMPWMKGLLTPFDFKKFAEINNKTTFKDIYGKEIDIIKDNINIILTKSQFKMWKYYESWEDYKEKFRKNNCEASKLNIEEIANDANINYQMLQTLTTLTNKELEKISETTVKDILSIGKDKQTMLRVLGATKQNVNKNYLQKSLLLYPEMLNDAHSKEIIKNKKKSMIKEARAGKLKINGKYTFIIPDLYAFCEWLFLGIETPKGLLENKQVYCNLFKEGDVDLLRAPHLYKEHAIRENIKNQNLKEWFTSNGVYTSTLDPISKILQFDNDGDRSLVVQDKTIIKAAKRDMDDIVPLYYEMKKAESVNITPEETFISLTAAYKANIGIISNDITKIWNSENPDIRAVQWLTMINNYVIDYAKTLYMPEVPSHVEEIISQFTTNKLPHFFKFAKDKESQQVEELNDSVVNNLYSIIPNKPIQFKRIAGKFEYKKLMDNPTRAKRKDIVDRYLEINRIKDKLMNSDNGEGEYYFYNYLKKELRLINDNPKIVVDTLISHLYNENSRFKSTLWNAYGDIIYDNLERNLFGTKACQSCSERFETVKSNELYCYDCKNENILQSKDLYEKYKR